jgi:hypothetical protein
VDRKTEVHVGQEVQAHDAAQEILAQPGMLMIVVDVLQVPDVLINRDIAAAQGDGTLILRSI